MNETYTVKAGDTLYGISNQFGVSVTELANINNVNAQTLQIGQILTIPNKTGTNPNNMFMYTVQPGDSLYKIAKKYNTTVQAITNLNNLKNTNLSIGQILRIPEMYTPENEMVLPNFKSYTVKAGDNLYTIAQENNISVEQIIKDNALTNNTLNIGQMLKIRINANEEIEECIGPDYTPPTSDSPTVIYTVKKGDNLYNIAKTFNTSINAIVNTNNLTNTNLSIGQKLKIPGTQNVQQTQTYIVKKGDNLYSIARRFNTTVTNIKNKNNLKSDSLSIGQQLII